MCPLTILKMNSILETNVFLGAHRAQMCINSGVLKPDTIGFQRALLMIYR